MENTITYIIPHRNVDIHREKNLMVVLDWVRSLKYKKEIIVVEQDDTAKLDLPKDINHIFIKNSGQFTKSWAMNVGIKASTNELIVMCDSDCFFNVSNMNSFLDKMLEGKYQAGTPNHYNFTRLKRTDTERVHENIKTFNEIRKDRADGSALGGGCFAATKEALHKVKLWDEDFIGWGGEDSAMGSKFWKEGWTYDGGQALRTNYLGYHLWHPSKSDTDGYMDNKKVNADLWNHRYRQLSLRGYKKWLNTVNINKLGNKKRFKDE